MVTCLALSVLREMGMDARALEGGIEGWRSRLSDHSNAALPGRDEARPSRWVTRVRPKIDRIACPWLIRRFIDAQAQFFFVEPSQVTSVAKELAASPTISRAWRSATKASLLVRHADPPLRHPDLAPPAALGARAYLQAISPRPQQLDASAIWLFAEATITPHCGWAFPSTMRSTLGGAMLRAKRTTGRRNAAEGRRCSGIQ